MDGSAYARKCSDVTVQLGDITDDDRRQENVIFEEEKEVVPRTGQEGSPGLSGCCSYSLVHFEMNPSRDARFCSSVH